MESEKLALPTGAPKLPTKDHENRTWRGEVRLEGSDCPHLDLNSIEKTRTALFEFKDPSLCPRLIFDGPLNNSSE